MHSERGRRAGRASLLLAVLLLSTGQAAGLSPDGDGSQTLEWTVSLEAMRAAIAQGQTVDVLMGDLGWQPLVLSEVSLFLPGQQKVEFLDENGTVVGEEPIVYWSYQGLARDDPASTAFLGMDDRGLYGFVDFLGTRYKFRPADEGHILAPGEEARVLVTWRSVRQAAWEAVAPFVPDPVEGTFESTMQAHGDPSGDLSVPDPWDSAATSSGTDNRAKDADRRTFQAGIVQAYADKRYRDYTGNYATRIANALGAQESMWQKVDISIKLSSVKAVPNFSDSGDCQTHLTAFTNGHTRDSTADAWQLFTGKNLNLLGCAWRETAGRIEPRSSRDSVVEAQDESNWDSYDPDETSDLGLVSGHELSHGWGEPDHPRDTRNCGGWVCYNIMADAVDPDVQEFWHTSGSKARIKQATKGQF